MLYIKKGKKKQTWENVTKLFFRNSKDFYEIYVGYLQSPSKTIWQHWTRIAWATRLMCHKNTGRENPKLTGLESMLRAYDTKESQLSTS